MFTKPRIYVNGTHIASTKLSVGKAHSIKACEELAAIPVKSQYKLKKAAFLDKGQRADANKKMRQMLTAVGDLSAKYVDGAEFRKYCCYDQEKVVAPPKFSNGDSEKMTDEKQEKLRIYWKKVRKFQHSLAAAENMVLLDSRDSDTQPSIFGKFSGTTLQYFEAREKRLAQDFYTTNVDAKGDLSVLNFSPTKRHQTSPTKGPTAQPASAARDLEAAKR